jgi:hypothetical protein
LRWPTQLTPLKAWLAIIVPKKIINFAVTLEYAALSSTLSDYMITLSRIVIPAWIAGIQGPWMDLSLTSLALDTRYPAGMTSFFII